MGRREWNGKRQSRCQRHAGTHSMITATIQMTGSWAAAKSTPSARQTSTYWVTNASLKVTTMGSLSHGETNAKNTIGMAILTSRVRTLDQLWCLARGSIVVAPKPLVSITRPDSMEPQLALPPPSPPWLRTKPAAKTRGKAPSPSLCSEWLLEFHTESYKLI